MASFSHPALVARQIFAATRDEEEDGLLPIHLACRIHAPVEVLATLVERDPTKLHVADPHTCDCSSVVAVAVVVVHGRVAIARRTWGCWHAIAEVSCRSMCCCCRFSCGASNPTDPPWFAVRCLLQRFPGSMAMRANAGQYPFMIATGRASQSAANEIVRADTLLVVPTHANVKHQTKRFSQRRFRDRSILFS